MGTAAMILCLCVYSALFGFLLMIIKKQNKDLDRKK